MGIENPRGIPRSIEIGHSRKTSFSEENTKAKASLDKTKNDAVTSPTRSVPTSIAPQGKEVVGRPNKSSAPAKMVNIGAAHLLHKSAANQLKQASIELKEVRKAYTQALSSGDTEATQTLEGKAAAVRQEIAKLQPSSSRRPEKITGPPPLNQRLVTSQKALLSAKTAKLETTEKEFNRIKTKITFLQEKIKHNESAQKKEASIAEATVDEIQQGRAKRPIGKSGEDSFEKMLEADLKASKLNDEIAADTTNIEELTNKLQSLNEEIEGLKGNIEVSF